MNREMARGDTDMQDRPVGDTGRTAGPLIGRSGERRGRGGYREKSTSPPEFFPPRGLTHYTVCT